MCSLVVEVMDDDTLNEKFIPKILALEKDKVPNVRFNIAKFLAKVPDQINE
jgi:hypothetical protein